MATLPPPKTKYFPETSLEKKCYNIVKLFKDYLPITNDGNRLAFGLYKFMTGEGDPPDILLRSSKLKIEGITLDELVKKISDEIEKIK
ncbi:MAG: hypothetical protein IIA49_09490 [Bacteroidetes bacterium]|nr:hypothetical protein [Bacteroidota bacterium]MCH7771234.1 hypothetical protein [Bacteroidota bacterium]MCH9030359.1 hypothetical protein [Bacteroidota bacterium]